MSKLKDDLHKVAEISLAYRNKPRAKDRIKVKSSLDAYEMFLKIWDKDKLELQEHFKVALMNNANQCLGVLALSEGGITGTVVDVRLVFAAACKAGATSIILAHNHPSGTLVASEADKQITAKCKRAGENLDIKVLDHIIVTPKKYLSFADEGLL